MTNKRKVPRGAQLGFDLGETDAVNERARRERETAHLPDTFQGALHAYRALIDQHHLAMHQGDERLTYSLRVEAYRIADKIEGGPGIFASEDSTGSRLQSLSACRLGAFPLWGQSGEFFLKLGTMRARVVIDGMLGLGGSTHFWPFFETHVVDRELPFLSETGYRHFSPSFPVEAGLTADTYVARVLDAYVRQELKGKLVRVKP